MITVIDYGVSNLYSLANALKKLKQSYEVVRLPQELRRAEKVILPGVGTANAAMQQLYKNGLIEEIVRLEVPVLGICLGMQLLAQFSDEGNTECLSIIPGRVRKFENTSELKIPQIGWNKVELCEDSPLIEGIPNNSYFYFVNSFYFDAPNEVVVGKTLYGKAFPSIIQKKNFYGVQFHPEKSGPVGLHLLRNFCESCY